MYSELRSCTFIVIKAVLGFFVALFIMVLFGVVFDPLTTTMSIILGPIIEEFVRYTICKKRITYFQVIVFASFWWLTETMLKSYECGLNFTCVKYRLLPYLAHFSYTICYISKPKIKYPFIIATILHMSYNYWVSFGFHMPYDVWYINNIEYH
jgi:hypothetical protein